MNALDSLPKVRTKILSERITIPVEPELKQTLYDLKSKNKIDISEWIRRLIREELLKLERVAS